MAWINECSGIVLSSKHVDEDVAIELGFDNTQKNGDKYYVKQIN